MIGSSLLLVGDSTARCEVFAVLSLARICLLSAAQQLGLGEFCRRNFSTLRSGSTRRFQGSQQRIALLSRQKGGQSKAHSGDPPSTEIRRVGQFILLMRVNIFCRLTAAGLCRKA